MAATATLPRTRKPKPPQTRGVKLLVPCFPDTRSLGVVRLRVGKHATDYFLSAAREQHTWTLTKVHPDPDLPNEYDVHLNPNPSFRSCECPGWQGKYHTCKHVHGLAKLQERGLLPS